MAVFALAAMGAGSPLEAPRTSESGNADLSIPGDPLLPPLEGPARLTSSFGEYRAGHYHAGLDYSTGGRVGRPVRAPAGGWVWRARVSGSGYGRALYLRLDDGKTVVFAHLSRFAAPIERAAEAEQDRRGEFEVDFRPREGSLRFARGEVVAWSGETGAGPPHLHAEVRLGDEADVAVQPLGVGWGVGDTAPPSLTRVRVAPGDAGSWVEGSRAPREVPLDPPPRVLACGSVALHVETEDRTAAEGPRLATYRVEATVDGRPLGDMLLGRVDWSHPAEVRWTYLESAVRERNERWLALLPPPRSRQPVHRRLDGAAGARLRLPPGAHEVCVTATDFAGNRTERTFTLEILEEIPPTWIPGPPAPEFRAHGAFLEVRLPAGADSVVARDPRGVPTPLPWSVLVGAAGSVHSLDATASGPAGLWSFEGSGSPGRVLGRAARVDPADARTVHVVHDGWSLEIEPDDLYEPLWIGVETGRDGEAAGDAERGLRPAGPRVRFTPWAAPLRGPIRISAAEAPIGAAWFSRRGGWAFEGAERDGGSVSASCGNLEELALLIDDAPPRITWIGPADGDTTANPPTLEARVSDRGTGVTWRTLRMELDGSQVLAEWDPEAGRYRAHVRGAIEPGGHVATVRAEDRVGNAAAASIRFQVR